MTRNEIRNLIKDWEDAIEQNKANLASHKEQVVELERSIASMGSLLVRFKSDLAGMEADGCDELTTCPYTPYKDRHKV